MVIVAIDGPSAAGKSTVAKHLILNEFMKLCGFSIRGGTDDERKELDELYYDITAWETNKKFRIREEQEKLDN